MMGRINPLGLRPLPLFRGRMGAFLQFLKSIDAPLLERRGRGRSIANKMFPE